jgi:hypothetical protein
MKPSNVVFFGVFAIFVIFGILTSNYLVYPVMGLITGFVLSWIYKIVTNEDTKLISNSRIGRN